MQNLLPGVFPKRFSRKKAVPSNEGGKLDLFKIRAESLRTQKKHEGTGELRLKDKFDKNNVLEDINNRKRHHLYKRLKMFEGYGYLYSGLSQWWGWLSGFGNKRLSKMFAEIRRRIWNVLKFVQAGEQYTDADLGKILKLVSNWAKQYQVDGFGHGWQLLVDIHNVGPYLGRFDDYEYVLHNAKDWLVNKEAWKSLKLNGSPKQFQDMFIYHYSKLVELYKISIIRPKRYYNLFEFYLNPSLWASPGATSMQVSKFKVNGKDASLRKTKWSTAINITFAEFKAAVLKAIHEQVVHVKQDEKLLKIRLLVSADNGFTWNVKYFLTVTEPTMMNVIHTFSPLGMSGNKYLEFWDDVFARTRNEMYVKYPLDYSAWDHIVQLWMVKLVIAGIGHLAKHIKMKDGKWTWLDEQILEALHKKLDNGVVIVRSQQETNTFRQLSGMFSGGPSTTLSNTEINHILLMVCFDMSKVIDVFNAELGDDVDLVLRNYIQCLRVKLFLDDVGAGVNDSKTFKKLDSDTFLQRYPGELKIPGVVEREGIFGIFTRSFHTERKPLADVDNLGPESVMEEWDSITIKMSRLGFVDEVWEEYGLREVAGSIKLKPSVIRKFLSTPKSLGGGGYYDNTDNKGVIIVSTKEDDKFTYKRKGLVSRYAKEIGKIGVQFLEDNLNVRNRNRIQVSVKHIDWKWEVRRDHVNHENIVNKLDLGPQLQDWVSATYDRLVFQKLVDDYDIDGLRAYLTPSSYVTLKRIDSSFNRTLVRKWLLGKLPYSPPTLALINPVRVKSVWLSYAQSVWYRYVHNGKNSMEKLLRGAVWAEYSTRREIKRLMDNGYLYYDGY